MGCKNIFVLKPHEKEKWKKQINSLKEHMESMSKRKRQHTPFPQENDNEGKVNDIFERCRDLCKVVLRSWDRGFWTLGEGWWIHMQAIAKEAKAHAHKKEKRRAKEATH